jgi:hypothetical protein
VLSLSELERLLGKLGLADDDDRASAVSRLASSSVFVGLVPLFGEGGPSLAIENVDGSILPMKVHLFLLGVVGASVVSLGLEVSAVSSLVNAPREE